MAKKRTKKSKTTSKGSRTKKAAKVSASKKASTSPKAKRATKSTKPKSTKKASAAGKSRKVAGKSAKRAAAKSTGPLPKILVSPDYKGKPTKLAKDTFPESAGAKDFKCFGPAATHDGELDEVRICDLGCFTQDGKDSNKYYHGAVVQHKKSKNWYAYFEWGRTGGSTCSFQFVACQSEEDARAAFAKQLHAKNDKRGEWVVEAGIRTLRAKEGKDCYLVRPMATRTTGLPDARRIKISRVKKTASTTSTRSNSDPKTTKLLRDLQLATLAYTRKSMADSSVPTQRAIDEARQILGEAQSQLLVVGSDIQAQVNDKRLMRLTELMFSRIPRKKKVGAAPSTWVLSANNVQEWQDDLDAFESALRAVDIEMHPKMDLLGDMALDMQWVCPDSDIGKFVYQWAPNATIKQHKKIKAMQLLNVWHVQRHAARGKIEKAQKRLLKKSIDVSERPLHQPRSRQDIPKSCRSIFKETNTAILFHGTRSVNVNAILRESLRMPMTLVAVALTGTKFGPGIYFTDDWKKSADYTNAKGSSEAGRKGAVRGRHAFMFIADVVLGTPYVAPEIHGYTKPPRGYHSIFGKAGHSGVDDNEFVVFGDDRFQLRYLMEFKTF